MTQHLDEIELTAAVQCPGLFLTAYREGAENGTDGVFLNRYKPGTPDWHEYEAGFNAARVPVCCDWPIGVEVAA